MTTSATRLTLYAIISAIEEDLRAVAVENLAHNGTPEAILGTTLYIKCIDRFSKDHPTDPPATSLNELITYADFAESCQLLQSHSRDIPASISSHINEHCKLLSNLIPIRNRVMHSRPFHIEDMPLVLDAANTLRQHAIWTHLTDVLVRIEHSPSHVLGITMKPPDSDRDAISHNLPIPDFDDTGFLGREKEVAEITKLCFGAFPVITIVGEGGAGKTALALKVAYDLLDTPNSPFNAIVWTTSKTSLLTSLDIVRIDGAISDSLGMLNNVASELAGQPSADPLQEIISYLTQFHILLIIDNLETILDDRVRMLMKSMPLGSKVIITSRIGLGAYEYPFKLQPMEEAEAGRLLRCLAKIRNVPSLAQTNNKSLAVYCRRMKNNPGYIKWFVAAVQAGQPPETVLARPEKFLEYCMENVYSYLSQPSRQILRSMICDYVSHTLAELAFFSDMDGHGIEQALGQLLTTNMITFKATPRGSSYETSYQVNELAREYIKRLHPISPEEFNQFQNRAKQLTAASEALEAEGKKNPFSFNSIALRSKGDLIAAKILRDALTAAKNKNFVEAERLIGNAKTLAPDYYEVHRVDAYCKVMQENIPAARDAYEAAIDLEPASAPLRLWYGGFILRYIKDLDDAMKCLKEGLVIQPGAFDIELEIGRVQLYKQNFVEAEALLGGLVLRTQVSVWKSRKAVDLLLQVYRRWAESCFRHDHDVVSALSKLDKFRAVYENCPASLIDAEIREKLESSLDLLSSQDRHIVTNDEIAKAKTLREWLTVTLYMPMPSDVVQPGRDVDGIIVRLVKDRKFGFIRIRDHQEVYFHYSQVTTDDPTRLEVGDHVRFDICLQDTRCAAVNVVLRT